MIRDTDIDIKIVENGWIVSHLSHGFTEPRKTERHVFTSRGDLHAYLVGIMGITMPADAKCQGCGDRDKLIADWKWQAEDWKDLYKKAQKILAKYEDLLGDKKVEVEIDQPKDGRVPATPREEVPLKTGHPYGDPAPLAEGAATDGQIPLAPVEITSVAPPAEAVQPIPTPVESEDLGPAKPKDPNRQVDLYPFGRPVRRL